MPGGQVAWTSSSGVCPAFHPALFCTDHQLMEPFKKGPSTAPYRASRWFQLKGHYPEILSSPQLPSASREAFLFRSRALLCGYRTGLSLGPIASTKTQQMLLINKHIDHTDMGCQGLNSWMKWALRVPSGSRLHLKGQQLLEPSWSMSREWPG